MNDIQQAASQVEQAIKLLQRAKRNLDKARSDQLYPLAVVIPNVQQILDVLQDPECTPEFTELTREPFEEDGEHCDPFQDPYVWTAERIEATKSLLFHEALHDGRLY